MNRHVPRQIVVRVEDLPTLLAGERLGLPQSRRSRAHVGSGGGGGDFCSRPRLFRAAATFPALPVGDEDISLKLRPAARFTIQ